MSGYRNQVDAAQARIAQLEDELGDLREALHQTPAVQARLAELDRRRSAALERLATVERRTRAAFKITFGVVLALLATFVAIIASLGEAGHPFNAALLGTILGAPVLLLVWWLGRSRRAAEEQRVSAIDTEIAKAREGAALRRIEASPAGELQAAEAEQQDVSAPNAPTDAHASKI